MDPIGSRPRVSQLPAAPQTPAPAATSNVAQTAAANATARSTFEPAGKGVTQNTAGAWRGPPGSEINKAINTMLDRMRQCPIVIKGDTVESLFSRAILDNKHITNEQLLAMTKVSIDQLADSPEERAKVMKKIPNARELPVHKFTVAMLSAATGVDPQKLSELTPSLGMTGSPSTPLLFAPGTEKLQRSTALHDFTDYLRHAGISGVNKAVWGVENRVLSAAVSFLGGGRY